MKARELCLKAYGENHLLYVRLCLNIGILYEDDRQFQQAYDYFVMWDKACMEVRVKTIFNIPGQPHPVPKNIFGRNFSPLNMKCVVRQISGGQSQVFGTRGTLSAKILCVKALFDH